MDVVHGKSLLECAITGSPISQMAIMHAYQTCIKRIVRFANSLQVCFFLPFCMQAKTQTGFSYKSFMAKL